MSDGKGDCGLRIADWGLRSAWTALVATLAISAGLAWSDDEPVSDSADDAPSAESEIRNPQSEIPSPPRRLYTGKVVLLQDALKKRGITSYSENEGQVVLETFDGRLLPIVSDWRGRAFYQDERLRDRKVELVCYQREGVPYLQVLVVFTFDEKDRRQYTDYWCDICAIPMYEVKPCDCCQDPIRLRFQLRGLPDYLEGDDRIPIGRAPDTSAERKVENVQ